MKNPSERLQAMTAGRLEVTAAGWVVRCVASDGSGPVPGVVGGGGWDAGKEVAQAIAAWVAGRSKRPHGYLHNVAGRLDAAKPQVASPPHYDAVPRVLLSSHPSTWRSPDLKDRPSRVAWPFMTAW